ncbi:putative xyloglucan endotransglucosylase/hydrolase protein [Trifolium repens]|nr:putative xyloglucan endotransglucosylase/hydrolase protein [Trifolium repens]
MNSAFKTTLTHSNPNRLSSTLRFFHSTPPLERKKRSFWDSRRNHYSRRFRRMQSKQSLLRDVNAYAEFMFQVIDAFFFISCYIMLCYVMPLSCGGF